MENFVGHLMTFDKKGEGEEIVDEEVMLEVTAVRQDGVIEIAFTDRNERCYLQVPIGAVLNHALKMVGEKISSE
jgi:hypothetical protein